MNITINGQLFTLLPEKALYKPDERLLIIADIHLGKAGHFRKEGIPIPARAQMNDYDNLGRLIESVNPQKVYFLGDLFHSEYNNDWQYFCKLISCFKEVAFTLVEGNHDIIDRRKFEELCISVVGGIEDNDFVYTHDVVDDIAEGKVNITGHVHPGIVLWGRGRQSIKLPCFYRHRNTLILPAFGVLTGLYSMERSAGADVYVVLPGRVQLL